jgi:predicted metal-binding membrane protein
MGTFLSPDLTPLSRRQTTTAGVLVALAIVAFIASSNRMSGMAMGGQFTAGSFGFFIVLWVVMMAAMMFPSVWPAVAMFGLVVRRQAGEGTSTFGRSAAFITGYLASWTLVGLIAFALLGLARRVGLDELSDTELARYVVAPVALAAAVYQVVPFKQACLRQCRGPFSFFLAHWRDGWQGALAMGSRHGAFCVGCCWMLMVVLLAVGVMSIAWMAIVSLAIAIEKLSPPAWSKVASGALAASLVVLALVALVRPTWLPGLDGMGGMDGNGMDDTPMTK